MSNLSALVCLIMGVNGEMRITDVTDADGFLSVMNQTPIVNNSVPNRCNPSSILLRCAGRGLRIPEA